MKNMPIYEALAQAFAAEGVAAQLVNLRTIGAVVQHDGLRGATVTNVSQSKPLFDAYQAQGTAELWNIHVSDRVVSPSTRCTVGRGHGRM